MGRSVRCGILHVDMDAFFAAVEVLDSPALKGRPVIVGGLGTRGVVASCSYEARVHGVRSAMPSVEARRRCPAAIFLPGRYERYRQVSGRLHEVLLRFTPQLEPLALDEAFLDVSGSVRLFGAPGAIAHQIRAAVDEALGLECAVGVARTKHVAKLASRAAKPKVGPDGVRPGAGVVVVEPDDELAFLHGLPVRALWGVGPAAAGRLEGVGLHSVADVAAAPEATLRSLLGSTGGERVAALARGDDPRRVETGRAPKSVGHEETFAHDLSSHDALDPCVLRLAEGVAVRLADAAVVGRTVTVEVRRPDLSRTGRSRTLREHTRDPGVLRRCASELLGELDVSEGVRLLGIRVSDLTAGSGVRQLSFAEAGAGLLGPLDAARGVEVGRQERLQDSVVAVRARYGRKAVGPAGLLGPGGVQVGGSDASPFGTL